MEKQKVHYEPHPVSPERKAELRAQGFRIVDAAFAPADYVRPVDTATDNDGSDGALSASQLKDELKKRNIEFRGNASRAVLQGLYDEAVAAEQSGDNSGDGSSDDGEAE